MQTEMSRAQAQASRSIALELAAKDAGDRAKRALQQASDTKAQLGRERIKLQHEREKVFRLGVAAERAARAYRASNLRHMASLCAYVSAHRRSLRRWAELWVEARGKLAANASRLRAQLLQRVEHALRQAGGLREALASLPQVMASAPDGALLQEGREEQSQLSSMLAEAKSRKDDAISAYLEAKKQEGMRLG